MIFHDIYGYYINSVKISYYYAALNGYNDEYTRTINDYITVQNKKNILIIKRNRLLKFYGNTGPISCGDKHPDYYILEAIVINQKITGIILYQSH